MKKRTINLGFSNPAFPNRSYAEGIDIHKAGINNSTRPLVSEGCLLISINKWDTFISYFNNPKQKNNLISIAVSRTMTEPTNMTRIEAVNKQIESRLYNPIWDINYGKYH
jgi:hypothetical protein